MNLVFRPGSHRRRHRGSRALVPLHSAQSEFTHEPGHSVAAGLKALPLELPPQLVSAISSVVALLEYPLQFRFERSVAARPRTGLAAPGRVVAGRGDRQCLADRLDPEPLLMVFDVTTHLCRPPSSSAAKKAEALLSISLARLSSRFSFSN